MKFSNGLCVALILSSCPAAALAQSITNLGTLPGATDSYAYGLSADGLVVAGQSGLRPFRWSAATGIQPLPMLEPLAPNQNAYGNALSADGSVIVGVSGDRAVRWTSAGVSALDASGSLGNAWASDVTADGGTIVVIAPAGMFVWQEASGLELIGASFLPRISANGTTFAGARFTKRGSKPVRWVPPRLEETLETGELVGGATDLSNDGSVMVGWSSSAAGGRRGFRWSLNSGYQLLPMLPGGVSAYANAVSGDGLLVAGYCVVETGEGGDLRAVVWTETLGTVSLRDLLLSRGADVSGWTSIEDISSVSADGRVVVGYGTFEGSTRAFLADISEPPPCAVADLFANGVVNSADLGIMLSEWGSANPETVSDINHDGHVDGFDLAALMFFWGPCTN